VILSDDINDDEMKCDGGYVEDTEGDSECAEDATSDDYCCAEVDATESCLHRNSQDEVGKDKKFYTHLTQMEEYSNKITRGY
jgi:hypothetical protein